MSELDILVLIGTVEGREQYIRDNAVSIVEDLAANVRRQAERIALLEKQVASLRLELKSPEQPA